jgi:hypothetical protein
VITLHGVRASNPKRADEGWMGYDGWRERTRQEFVVKALDWAGQLTSRSEGDPDLRDAVFQILEVLREMR